MVAAEESDEGGDSLSTNRMSSEKDGKILFKLNF